MLPTCIVSNNSTHQQSMVGQEMFATWMTGSDCVWLVKCAREFAIQCAHVHTISPVNHSSRMYILLASPVNHDRITATKYTLGPH